MRRNWPSLLFGLGLVALGLGMFVIALQIPVRPVDPVLGPRLFPLAITLGLALLAILSMVSAWAGFVPAELGREPFGWLQALFILGGLVVFALLVDPLGFVVAAAALFILVARAFRSRRLWLDIAIGFALSVVIFVIFNYGLGLKLPAGQALSALAGAF